MLKLGSGSVKYYQRQAGEPDPFVLNLPSDYTFESGNVVAFVGSNGSGKSTLLNCIAGLNEKQYHRDGIKATWYCDNLDLDCPASAVVAYLEAHPSLLEIYSVREYMQLAEYSRKSIAANLKKMQYKSLPDQEINETIEMFDLRKVLQFSTEMLSSGQKKRLGLAMILLQQSPFIILDEPRANLDKKGEKLLNKWINTWEKSGNIVFMATHDEKDIGLANRFFLVENKQVEKVTRDEVLKWINV